MNKWLMLVVLVLVVLTAAMGFKNIATSFDGGVTVNAPSWMMAPTTAPAPAVPWGLAPTTAPAPAVPWGLAPTTAPAPAVPWGD